MTDTEAQLRKRIAALHPGWFDRTRPEVDDARDLVDIWPLPHGRYLFSSAYVTAPDFMDLNVYNPHDLRAAAGRPHLKCVGSVEGHGDLREGAIAYAVEWMQGLREESLRRCDQNVLGWLGELAYRMTPKQLRVTETVALALPQDSWGSFDNPNDVADKRLTEVLSVLGFSNDYIAAHLG